jgi:uncharacterized membrane protein
MDAKTLASWLIIAGLLLIAAQVIVSIVTVVKTKKAKDDSSTAELGDIFSEILKGLVASVPLGVLGFLLILVGAIIGGYLSLDALFPRSS